MNQGFARYVATRKFGESILNGWQDVMKTEVTFKDNINKEILFRDYYNFIEEYGNPIDYTYNEFKEKLMVMRL